VSIFKSVLEYYSMNVLTNVHRSVLRLVLILQTVTSVPSMRSDFMLINISYDCSSDLNLIDIF
jgi:hypothetical protein